MQHQCPLRFLGFPLEDAKAIAGRDEWRSKKFPAVSAQHLFPAASALQLLVSAHTDSYLAVVNSTTKTTNYWLVGTICNKE